MLYVSVLLCYVLSSVYKCCMSMCCCVMCYLLYINVVRQCVAVLCVIVVLEYIHLVLSSMLMVDFFKI